MIPTRAQLAQLVEHYIDIVRVRGSSPLLCTIKKNPSTDILLKDFVNCSSCDNALSSP